MMEIDIKSTVVITLIEDRMNVISARYQEASDQNDNELACRFLDQKQALLNLRQDLFDIVVTTISSDLEAREAGIVEKSKWPETPSAASIIGEEHDEPEAIKEGDDDPPF